MKIEKIIFDGMEIDFVVSIVDEYIERNEDELLEDTIILNDTIDEIRKNGLDGEMYG